MTKAEELNLLEKIAELIASAGADSYIAMTFDGIVEVCRQNIENDFGDSPVNDLELVRESLHAEIRMHDDTKRMLAEAQGNLKEAMRDIAGTQDQIDDLREQRDTLGECMDGCNEIMDRQDAEIRKLKAEIVRMRMERMTEEQIAELYDNMTEGARL